MSELGAITEAANAVAGASDAQPARHWPWGFRLPPRRNRKVCVDGAPPDRYPRLTYRYNDEELPRSLTHHFK